MDAATEVEPGPLADFARGLRTHHVAAQVGRVVYGWVGGKGWWMGQTQSSCVRHDPVAGHVAAQVGREVHGSVH